MHTSLRALSAAVVTWSIAHSANATTLQVGPGRTYTTVAAAATAAHGGDTIEIDAGTYTRAAGLAHFTADDLTIRGVGATAARIDGDGTVLEDKALWIVSGARTIVEHIEFTGAGGTDVASSNGAGIRDDGSGLTVRDCYFHDNQEGILGGDGANSDVVIETSHFERNGVMSSDPTYGSRAGYEHNIYIGHARTLTVRGCWFAGAWVGHNIKSRAAETRILYNRVTDEGTTTTSYELDFPDGGRVLVIGNLIEQSSASQNPGIVAFAEESASNPRQEFWFVNNTVVNDLGHGTFVLLARAPTTGLLADNLFVGGGTMLSGTVPQRANLSEPDAHSAGLANAAAYDYRLTAGSPAIDTGSAPGMAGADALAPVMEYAQPASTTARPSAGALDVGAYEWAQSGDAGSDGGVDGGSGSDGGEDTGPASDGGSEEHDAGDSGSAGRDAGDAGDVGGTHSGCGCTVPARRSERDGAAGLLAAGLVVAGAAASGRRRRRTR